MSESKQGLGVIKTRCGIQGCGIVEFRSDPLEDFGRLFVLTLSRINPALDDLAPQTDTFLGLESFFHLLENGQCFPGFFFAIFFKIALAEVGKCLAQGEVML